jgi:hypothetical protein
MPFGVSDSALLQPITRAVLFSTRCLSVRFTLHGDTITRKLDIWEKKVQMLYLTGCLGRVG